MFTLGLISDLHFGQDTRYEGKLRKLSAQAPELAQGVVERLRGRFEPELLVNLGDVIEDENPDIDLERYHVGLDVLRDGPWRLVSVAGNHDHWSLEPGQLRAAWGMAEPGPLYYAFELGGYHFAVLYTHERQGVDITMEAEQLAWLRQELERTALPTVVLMHHSAAEQDLTGNRWFEGEPHRCLLEQRRELRALLRRTGRTVAVFNGHLHWNHLFVEDGIPYVTLQSVVENIDEDEPGRPAEAFAVVRLSRASMLVEIGGAEPARYQFELSR